MEGGNTSHGIKCIRQNHVHLVDGTFAWTADQIADAMVGAVIGGTTSISARCCTSLLLELLNAPTDVTQATSEVAMHAETACQQTEESGVRAGRGEVDADAGGLPENRRRGGGAWS